MRRISRRKLSEKTGVFFATRVEIFESVITSMCFVVCVCVLNQFYVQVIWFLGGGGVVRSQLYQILCTNLPFFSDACQLGRRVLMYFQLLVAI